MLIVLNLLLKMPDVIANEETSPSEEEWKQIEKTIHEAIRHCDNHRADEGEKLRPILIKNCKVIEDKLKEVEQADPERIENIKDSDRWKPSGALGS